MMMSVTSIRCLVIVFATILKITKAQIPGIGGCPNVHVVQNFDLHRYLGLWYEVKKYPFIFTLGGKCITAEYGLNANGTVSVFNKQIRNGREETILGSARIIRSGVLGVTFSNVPFQTEANYNVLDTDYQSYAVVYSCNSFLSLVNGRIVWILTRTRFPSQAVIDKAYQVMRSNGLSTSYLASTDNTDCPDELPNGIDSFRY
ncbi:CLUMA_CG003458, isoform A [Clunio marinus]|uniref:Apolipoprotein D n=1 Tax=Clunio marinus TaxID=568069 RepID=A0A1J1HP68_9DIPT|nr:CLUMA_CG003458, isoform A [Clunio marinus]